MERRLAAEHTDDNHIEITSNYDKHPFIAISSNDRECLRGWDAICQILGKELDNVADERKVLAVECYPGTHVQEVCGALESHLNASLCINTTTLIYSEDRIDALLGEYVTDDPIFGKMNELVMQDLLDPERVAACRSRIDAIEEGLCVICGPGASLLSEWSLLVYADMPRWEIQQRMRNHEVGNLGTDNAHESINFLYKRGYFVDWRIADRLKRKTMDAWDFVLDTTSPGNPLMISGAMLRAGLKVAAQRPFRVVPFFDPGPWGGQWMKEVCDLDRTVVNYAWCFDCVPEENSLVFGIGRHRFEIPAINLVFFLPEELLGPYVYEMFGAEFPIRFDFLDTMDGGNLSLQVHPVKDYIKEHFGLDYTQDESYYLLDAKDGAHVYLGLQEDVDPDQMIADLESAQEGGPPFDAEKHVRKWPVKKHDHVLIPAGTVHCSGKDSMVLEISATPYIFTFKLWDWGRLGLDGLPRPINIDHGKKVIQWERRETWTGKELINRIERIDSGDGWVEERTGLHELEFIETRRHWFTKTVPHRTHGSVNVLNLVEGREVIVESQSGAFEPFVVHYAETFIVPASVGEYTISTYGESEGNRCATIKAFIRRNSHP